MYFCIVYIEDTYIYPKVYIRIPVLNVGPETTVSNTRRVKGETVSEKIMVVFITMFITIGEERIKQFEESFQLT